MPPPSQKRSVWFDFDQIELVDVDRFAGMGASAELIGGKPEGDLATFQSLQEAIGDGADQVHTASNALVEVNPTAGRP